MKIALKKGTTSKLLQVFIQDSSSTTGAGLAGLVFNTASLTAYYYREGAATATAITLATMTLGTWATGGFVVVDGTNMPGLYQLGIPDAALATGANSVVIYLKGATNMVQTLAEIELVDYDPYDSVRLGLTAMPNAAAAASGGLPTVDASNAVKVQSGTGANQISLSSGLVTLAGVTHTGAVIPTVTNLTNAPTAGDLTAAMKTSVEAAVWDATRASHVAAGSFGQGAASVQGNVTGSVGSVTGAVGSVAGAVGSVTAGVTVTTNNDKTGYALSAAGVQAVWDALTAALTTVGSIGKLLVDNVNATISSRLATAGYTAPLDAAGTRAAVGLAAANLDTQLAALPTATENADELLKRDWTSVTGEAARSVLNALRFLRNKWSIAGGTLTVTKEDDATTAWTGAVTTTAGDPASAIDPL